MLLAPRSPGIARSREKNGLPPENRLGPATLTSQPASLDEIELLARLLDSLSEIDRAVLVVSLDDLTNREIAETMGISDGASRPRISRIRYQLKARATQSQGNSKAVKRTLTNFDDLKAVRGSQSPFTEHHFEQLGNNVRGRSDLLRNKHL